ncbi:MAG TPA: alpha/beta hydrolase-fold protein [Trichormus sp.]
MAMANSGVGQTHPSAESHIGQVRDTPASSSQSAGDWRDEAVAAAYSSDARTPKHSYPPEQTITVDGGNRQGSATLMLPDNYDPTKKYPLIVALHGYQGNVNDIGNMMNLDRLRKEGNIVLVPAAKDHTWNGSGISFFGDAKGSNGQPINDVDFVKSAIGQVESNFNVNRNDITLAGFSQGGQLAYELAASMDDSPSRLGSVRTLVSAAGSDPDARAGHRLDPLTGTNIVQYEPGTNYMQGLGNVLTGDPSVADFLPQLIAAKKGLPNPGSTSDINGVQVTSFIDADHSTVTKIYEPKGEHAWPGQPKSYDSDLMGRGSISHVDLTDWVSAYSSTFRNR